MYKLNSGNYFFVCASNEKYKKYLNLIHDLDQHDERFKRLKYHLENDNYFITLAGILDTIAEEDDSRWPIFFKRIAEDLRFLNANYVIKKRQP